MDADDIMTTPSITITGKRDLFLVAAVLALVDKRRAQSGTPPAPGSVEIQAAIKTTLESCAAAQAESEEMGYLSSGTSRRPSPPQLTSTEAAALLGVSRSTVNRNAAKYRGERYGIKWLFPAEYLHDLIGSNEC